MNLAPVPPVLPHPDASSLLQVCRLLNEAGARYLVAGAHAVILHGVVRDTQDVDLLIERTAENYARVIAALSQLPRHAAAKLQPADFDDHAMVKVADEITVDITTSVWHVTYAQAEERGQTALVEGVRIPYLALPDLLRSKGTYSDQDSSDVDQLRELSGG